VRRRRVTSWLGVLVSIVALGAVAWWISRQESPRLPESGVGYAWLGLALLLTAVTLALRGLRWHWILQLSGVPHRPRDAIGLTLVAYMGNNVLPARGGELLKIGLMGERTTARRRELLGTVLVERSLDAAVLALLFAALTWTGVDGAAGGDGSATLAAAGLGIAAASLVAYLWLRRRGRFERFAAVVRPVARAFRLFTRPAGIPPAVASLVIWCLEGLTFVFIARAIGVELEPLSALAVVVLASLFAAIPAAPGYVGTFDAGMLLGLNAAGVEGGDAVGVLLLVRFLFFVPVTIAGLAVLVLGYGGLRRRRSVAPQREHDLEQVPDQQVAVEQLEHR
jgi:glycosyltransferase 2 family protein